MLALDSAAREACRGMAALGRATANKHLKLSYAKFCLILSSRFSKDIYC